MQLCTAPNHFHGCVCRMEAFRVFRLPFLFAPKGSLKRWGGIVRHAPAPTCFLIIGNAKAEKAA